MTKYFIVDKMSNSVTERDNVKSVSALLLGRILSNLVIIKSDENGDRLYKASTGDVFVIEKELEAL